MLKKYYFIILLSLALAVSPIHAKPANAWLEFPGQFLGQALRTLADQIKGIMVGAVKQAAAQAIMQQVSSIVGGGSGSAPMFITDFRDFLTVQPRKETNVFMNDYISNYFNGRGSLSYEGFGGGGNSKYTRNLTKMSKAATSESKSPAFTYRGDPEKMFASGNFKDMGSFMNGNDPWTTRQRMLEMQAAKENELRYISQTKALAGQGFLGKEVKGKTITPGSLTKDIMANAQDLGNKIIGGANSLPEVITSVVSSAVSQSLQNGIGSAKNYVDEKDSASTGTTGSIYSGSQSIGTAAQTYPEYKKAACAANPNDPKCP